MFKEHNNNYMPCATYSNAQLSILVILRVIIGWHFLYEGITKIMNPNWTSVGFLLDSKGPLGGIFRSLASNPELVTIIDFMNAWGLAAVGFGLITGLLTATASIAGMVLLSFYYLSHPPFIGVEYVIPSEGSYLVVNKNLIEFFTLWIIYLFPTGKCIGLDRFLFQKNS